MVEFKKAENNFDFDDFGKYFSALSNEANLRGLDFTWLIFVYDEKKHEIIGTSYKNGEEALNNLKHDFSQHTTDGQTLRDIIPIEVDQKRILMFKIPASPRNIVMKWKGIAYGRDGESLKPLNQSKQDEIRNQTPYSDWSAEIVPNATLDDLDEVAIAKARKMFKKVHSRIPVAEVNGWSDEKLTALAKQVKGPVEQQATIDNWNNRDDIKAELKMNNILLAGVGYPPKIHNEVFKEILEQAKNFKQISSPHPYSTFTNDSFSLAAEP